MLPVVGVPKTVQRQMRTYRELFRRSEGFESVSRYIAGLLVSPNKTLQGIHATQVWEGNKPGYRARHEAGWDAEDLLPRPRRLIAPEHRNRGREVRGIALKSVSKHQLGEIGLIPACFEAFVLNADICRRVLS